MRLSNIKQIWDAEPTFVNSEGFKWWLDKDMTKYALEPDLDGIKLKDISAWVVESPEGKKSRVLLEGQKIIWEGSGLEQQAIKIDIMKINKKF